MCDRYTLVVSGEVLKDYYSQLEYDEKYEPSYNIAPTQQLPVVTEDGLELMMWGLVPSSAKEFKPTFTSINARAETIAEKPLYSQPFKTRRALIPASGFYVWQQRPTFKQPYYFQLPDRELFSFAGLFDVWFDSAGAPHKSYTIITTTPNPTLSGIHDRMPVILDRDEEKHWLDPTTAPENLQLLLNPYDREMLSHEVHRDVGNVKNNHEKLMFPLNSE
jgi:putative SOS response-associated peptidase YedK